MMLKVSRCLVLFCVCGICVEFHPYPLRNLTYEFFRPAFFAKLRAISADCAATSLWRRAYIHFSEARGASETRKKHTI